MTAPDPEYATAAAVAGLAREVEALRREVEKVPKLAKRIESVAGLAARVAHQIAASQAAEEESGPATWLGMPADTSPAEAGTVLAGLAGWMAVVYLRYADAAQSLPDCWLWHPDVVEELLWLSQAWHAAYTGETASIRAVGDWHDRHRPGVVTRIRATAGACSIENHQPGNGQPTLAPTVPLTDATTAIANWWATARTGPPPTPTADQLAAATARRTPRGHR